MGHAQRLWRARPSIGIGGSRGLGWCQAGFLCLLILSSRFHAGSAARAGLQGSAAAGLHHHHQLVRTNRHGRQLKQDLADVTQKVQTSSDIASKVGEAASEVASKAGRLSQALSVLAKVSSGLGALGTMASLIMSFIPGSDPMDAVKEQLAQVNEKLDTIQKTLDNLKDEMQVVVDNALAIHRYIMASAWIKSTRETMSDYFRTLDPNDAARVIPSCVSMYNALGSIMDSLDCAGIDSLQCLLEAFKSRAELEQNRFDQLVGVVLVDLAQGIQLQSACDALQHASAETRQSNLQRLQQRYQQILTKVNDASYRLQTDFWSKAVGHARDALNNRGDQPNEGLAQSIFEQFNSSYPFMHWGVYVYDGVSGDDNHQTNACIGDAWDCLQSQFPCSGAWSDFRVNGKSIHIQYRNRATPIDPATADSWRAQLDAAFGTCDGCADDAKVMLDLAYNRVSSFLLTVKHGNGLRGFTSTDPAAGQLFYEKMGGAIVSAAIQLIDGSPSQLPVPALDFTSDLPPVDIVAPPSTETESPPTTETESPPPTDTTSCPPNAQYSSDSGACECGGGDQWTEAGDACCPPNAQYNWGTIACECSAGFAWNLDSCVEAESAPPTDVESPPPTDTPNCPLNSEWDGTQCSCNQGTSVTWDATACCPPNAEYSSDSGACECGGGDQWTEAGDACCPPNAQYNWGTVACECSAGFAWDVDSCAASQQWWPEEALSTPEGQGSLEQEGGVEDGGLEGGGVDASLGVDLPPPAPNAPLEGLGEGEAPEAVPTPDGVATNLLVAALVLPQPGNSTTKENATTPICLPNAVFNGSCGCIEGYQLTSFGDACCPPHASYNWTSAECECPAWAEWTGDACCPVNAIYDGQTASCWCEPGYLWDTVQCVPMTTPLAVHGHTPGDREVCYPNAVWDGEQCACGIGMMVTQAGDACCPPNAFYTAATRECQCQVGHEWTGEACCPAGMEYNWVREVCVCVEGLGGLQAGACGSNSTAAAGAPLAAFSMAG